MDRKKHQKKLWVGEIMRGLKVIRGNILFLCLGLTFSPYGNLAAVVACCVGAISFVNWVFKKDVEFTKENQAQKKTDTPGSLASQ